MSFRKLLTLLFVPFGACIAHGQLIVDTAMPVNQMIQNLVGPGVQIFNVQVTAAPGSYGYYYSNNTELGTNEGLLLTTGQAVNAIGPNNSTGLPQIGPGGVCLNCSQFSNNFPGSQLLNQAQDRTTFDACMFEFDIIPQGDSLRFKYSFASEEYLEWVNSPFNDVFGFYISGPNVGTNVNIALVPNTGQVVAINTVNHLSNTQYFYNNQNPFGQFVQYDGFTVNLVAAIGNLIPCEVYHLKLIIADGSDRIYDSGVFVNQIESNPVLVLTTTAGGTDFMIEGCNDGTISFCREEAQSTPQDVVFWLGGTAVNGVDYDPIGTPGPLQPNTITIPANQTCASISVNTIADGIPEDDQYITIYLGNPLCNNVIVLDSVNFYIVDQLEVTLAALPDEICAGQCTTLSGTAIIEGTSAFTWSPLTGIADPFSLTTSACPTETTTYTLNSTLAACTGQAQVTIEVSNIQVTLTPTPDNCGTDDTGAVTSQVNGATEPVAYSWTGPNGFTSQDASISGLAPGQYCVTATDDIGCVANACANVVEENLLVFTSQPVLSSYTCFPISCNGASDGAISISVGGGVLPYTFHWVGPDGFESDDEDLTGLLAGTYVITVTDGAGCEITNSILLSEPQPLAINVEGTVDLLCTGVETGSALVSATGGCSPYFFSWSHDPTLQAPLAQNLGSGTYFVSVQDVNGCSSAGSVEIEINDPIDPLAVVVTEVLTYPGGFNTSCPGATDGAVDITITGGSEPYAIQWTGPGGFSSLDEDISGLSCGNYSVIITDDNNCVVSTNATVTCVPQIQINFTITPNPCNAPDAGLGAITLNNTTGGNGGVYGYEWTGPDGFTSTNEDLTGINSGSYTLTVTDATGCTRDFQFLVGTNDAFTVTPTLTHATCAGSCDGSISIDLSPDDVYTIAWTGPSGALPPSQTLNGLCAGTYVATIETSQCQEQFQYTITEPDPVTITVANQATPLCFGQNSGSIDIEVSGGTGNLAIQWAAVPGSFFSGSTNEDLNGLFDGCYPVTVTDENGCSANQTICLTSPQLMTISVQVTQFNGGYNISCAGAQDGQISVTVSGGTPDCTQFSPFCYLYDWSNCSDVAPNDPNSNLLTALSGGVYCVNVFDANGCLATTTINMAEPDPISDNAIIQNVSCNGANDGSINPNLQGGSGTYTSYSWTGNLGVNSPNATTLTNLGPGCYTLVATDNNQCSEQFTWCITQPDPLTLTVQSFQQPLCSGQSAGDVTLLATGGTLDYVFTTSGPGGPYSGNVLTGLLAGTYSASVIDDNGCTASQQFQISDPLPLQVSITPIISDPGQFFTLQCFGDTNGALQAASSGGTPNYSFVWTNESQAIIGNNALLTNLPAGEYCVESTDANGCTAQSCFTITQPDQPLSVISDILLYDNLYNVSCFGECDGAISIEVSGGVEPYIYLWEIGTGELSLDQNQTDLCTGPAEVLVSDANGCSTLEQFNLNTPAPVVVQSNLSQFIGGVNIQCNNLCNGTADITVFGDHPPFLVEWTTPSLPDGNSQSNLCAGFYEYMATDSRGCDLAGSFTLTQPEPVFVIQQSDFDCETGTLTICAIAGGGIPNYTYTWSTDESGVCIQPVEGGEICATAEDANGCPAQVCETYFNPAVLAASASVSQTNCGQSNGTITVSVDSGTGPFSFDWTGNGIAQGSQNQSGLSNGTYTVTITDAFECSITLSFQIDPADDIVVNTSIQNLICFDDDTGSIDVQILNAAQPVVYSWSLGGSPVAGDESLTGLSAGVYTLNWSDADGCTGTELVTVAQPDSLTINATISLFSNGYNVSANGATDGAISTEVTGGTGPYSYEWNPDVFEGNSGSAGLAPGTYELTVIDANGCTADTTIILREPFRITLPTGLSPNGDGANDTYVILGIEGFPRNEFKVFNRWGNLVYEKVNYNNEWSGQSRNGDTLPDGTYYVIFTASGNEFNTYVDLRR